MSEPGSGPYRGIRRRCARQLPAGSRDRVRAGAGIGWHKDRPVFGDVAGISLLSSCTFRLRRRTAKSFERSTLVAEPRSVYLLRGPSRTEWQHSIPGVESLRYSVTFRNVLEGGES
ncbi:alpha-ketoglutarate-dependent dioxygenase AlkB [Bradyrhizobium sp. S3.5.5]|uniref:alpha-ketoglutarate-dependent dioxygenase AlkB n=1 Tax=unclassified Bradyrhizobium TaxID=2631580 RepID=UPI003398A0C7